MSFQVFNTNTNYFDANNVTQNKFLEGVAAYFKSKPNAAINQAYVRAVGGQAIQTAITLIWTQTPPHLVGAPKLAHLYLAVDDYWTNTVVPGGNGRLTTEQNNRQTYWTTGPGANTMPTLEDYAKHGVSNAHLARLLTTPRQVTGYLALLTAAITPYLEETRFCKYNQNHKHAVDTQGKIAALANHINLGNLTANDGSYNGNDAKWIAVEDLANYWIRELPNVASRLAIYNAIDTYNGAGKNASLFRLVSEGEKGFVTTQVSPTIAQGPTSYERHKWFFAGGGAPGVGHAYKLELKLKGDGWTFLYNLAQEVNDEARATAPFALVKKSNEHLCVGIHEELLAVFCNKMVTSISVIK